MQTWHALFDASTELSPKARLDRIDEENGIYRLTFTHELEGAPGTESLMSGSMPRTGGGWPGC